MDSRIYTNIPQLSRILHNKSVPLPAGQIVKITTEELFDRQLIIIRNIGEDTIYLGSSSVSEESGFPLYVNEVIVLPSKKELFAISPTKDGEVRVIEG